MNPDRETGPTHLVPTSLFLTHPLEGARFFKRDGTDTAQRFLDGLNLNDAQIQDIADSMRFFSWVRPRGGATPKSLRWHLRHALEQGEIGVIREAPAQATTPRAAEPDVVPATGRATGLRRWGRMWAKPKLSNPTQPPARVRKLPPLYWTSHPWSAVSRAPVK